MFIGIEFGGTKLQLGVGRGDGPPLAELVRLDVERSAGAEGICRQIQNAAAPLVERHHATAIGIGFGGPVDARAGRVVTSHQISGWDDFPLIAWCREQFGLPAVLANDTDCGGLAEARFGAGRGRKVVFYTNVGSGIGGALMIDGRLYCDGQRVTAEIGHLRPGVHAEGREQTVESLASGWAISAAARRLIQDGDWAASPAARDLLHRCHGDAERLTTVELAQAAAAGNAIALAAFGQCCRTFGWAVAQMITLLAPDIVVVGGGVACSGEAVFLAPLREEINRYVFPPQLGRFEVAAAALGEQMVVYGALALAAGIDAAH
jgi:glucokinase